MESFSVFVEAACAVLVGVGGGSVGVCEFLFLVFEELSVAAAGADVECCDSVGGFAEEGVEGFLCDDSMAVWGSLGLDESAVAVAAYRARRHVQNLGSLVDPHDEPFPVTSAQRLAL